MQLYTMQIRICVKMKDIVVKGNFVFWFGTQFNSTLNFTQSGWLILFSPDLSLRATGNWVSCQTHSLWLENAVQCRCHTGRSSITFSLAGQRRPVQTSHCGSRIAAAAAWTHEGTHLIYGSLQGIHKLDGFPHVSMLLLFYHNLLNA